MWWEIETPPKKRTKSNWWQLQYFLCSPRTLGKISDLTSIFSRWVGSTTNQKFWIRKTGWWFQGFDTLKCQLGGFQAWYTDINIPYEIHGLVYLPTWTVDFYGLNVGKYTSPMDPMGMICLQKHSLKLYTVTVGLPLKRFAILEFQILQPLIFYFFWGGDLLVSGRVIVEQLAHHF